MRTKEEFKNKAEALLEELEKALVIDEMSDRELKCDLERDILVRFTELVHAFDKEHPLKKVLYDTMSYNFNNSFCLGGKELRVFKYCIKSFITYLDDFVE